MDYHGVGISIAMQIQFFCGTCSMQNDLTSVNIVLVSGCSNLDLNHIYYKKISSPCSQVPFVCYDVMALGGEKKPRGGGASCSAVS